MTTGGARWEWRTFGANLGAAEAEILACASAAGSSDEIYLVSERPDVNVKIRDRVLDIKQLQRVDAAGLEQWAPILKAPFPIDMATIARACALWQGRCPELTRTHYTLNELLELIARTSPAVTAVGVSKRRRGGEMGGCLVEVADLAVGGQPIRTLAVESDDPALVLATVRRLGLDREENVNYVKALQRILHLTRAPGASVSAPTAPGRARL